VNLRLKGLPHAAVATLLVTAASLSAQRHSAGSSPPTAPPAGFARTPNASAPQQTFAPVSTGLGAIQFFPVNTAASAPQSITRQLQSDDERTRQGALLTLGVPSQYLQKGHVPYPHSVEMEMAPLSNTDDLDAMVTVELDHHLVTAVLMPINGDWRRIATLIFPTAFADPTSTPSTFLRTTRSLLQPTKYRAVFHARETQANGDFTENEAHLRILNNRAIITTSFVSDARQCDASAEVAATPAPTDKKSEKAEAKADKKDKKLVACNLTQRWLQPDLTDPNSRRFFLVTATGTLSPKEAAGPLANNRFFQLSHLHTFACQPFTFSDSNLRYEPTGYSEACKKPGSSK